MFLFIDTKSLLKGGIGAFKYISCSYLSINERYEHYQSMRFKYISCSYLSSNWNRNIFRSLEFKYISCSYLSNVFTYFLLLHHIPFPLIIQHLSVFLPTSTDYFNFLSFLPFFSRFYQLLTLFFLYAAW